MKKKFTVFWILLFVVLTFTACAPSFAEPASYDALPESYQKETDYPLNFLDLMLPSITPAEDGYFLFRGNLLFYFDKETKNASVVCNRPECVHDDESCSAFFMRARDSFLQYYEGKLYAAADEYDHNYEYSCWLYEVNPADCTRRKLCQLPYGEDDIIIYMMHRGYLYMNAFAATSPTITLERVALNELAEKSLTPELLYEKESRSFSRPYMFGNHFYFPYTEPGTIGMKTFWVDIDLKTGEASDIVFPNDRTGMHYFLSSSYEDALLFSAFDNVAFLENGLHELVYYRYDPNSGALEPFTVMPDRGEGISDFLSWDGENFIACYYDNAATSGDFPGSPQEMRILNADLETVKRVPLDYYMAGYLTGDTEFSFFETMDENLYVIDKRGEEMQVIKVFE